MKNKMPLDGLGLGHDSGSVHCDMLKMLCFRTAWGGNIKGNGKVRFLNKGTIILNTGKVQICQGCIIENYGVIEFKGSSFVSENSKLLIREKLEMGSYTRIGFNSCIMDSNDHFLVDMINHSVKSMTSPIVIGNWNWMGCHTFVKKGTITPDFIIVAAPYAVLYKDYSYLTKGSVIGGTPAKLIRETNQRIIFNPNNEDIIRKWFFAHREATDVSVDDFTDDLEQFCS